MKWHHTGMKTSLKLSQTVHDILRLLGTCCIFSNHPKVVSRTANFHRFSPFFFSKHFAGDLPARWLHREGWPGLCSLFALFWWGTSGTSPIFEGLEVREEGVKKQRRCLAGKMMMGDVWPAVFFLLPFLGMIASKHSSWTREICSISLYMIYKSFRSTLNPHRIVEGMNYSAAIISSDSSWSFFTNLPPKVYQNRGRCWKWDREAIIGNMVNYLSDAKDRMMKAEDGLGSSVDRCSPLSFWGPAHFQGLC